MELNVKLSDIDLYTKLYLSVHPDIATEIDNTYKNYRCQYAEEGYARSYVYKLQLISPNCWKIAYREARELYLSPDNFNEFYH